MIQYIIILLAIIAVIVLAINSLLNFVHLESQKAILILTDNIDNLRLDSEQFGVSHFQARRN
ncbi:hypothetical protein ES703_86369 [subsurface metagenome]